ATDPDILADVRNNFPPYVIDPSNPKRLLFGGAHVFETINQGTSWREISPPLAGFSQGAEIDSLAVAPTDGNTIYAAAAGRVFVHVGGQWPERESGLPQVKPVETITGFLISPLEFKDLLVDPTDANIAYVVAANFGEVTGGGHVWMTKNAGMTWTNISGDL